MTEIKRMIKLLMAPSSVLTPDNEWRVRDLVRYVLLLSLIILSLPYFMRSLANAFYASRDPSLPKLVFELYGLLAGLFALGFFILWCLTVILVLIAGGKFQPKRVAKTVACGATPAVVIAPVFGSPFLYPAFAALSPGRTLLVPVIGLLIIAVWSTILQIVGLARTLDSHKINIAIVAVPVSVGMLAFCYCWITVLYLPVLFAAALENM